MAKKWTPERAKKETTEKILAVLAKKNRIRWSDLLKETGLSSRTLKNALERMEFNFLVRREVPESEDYPPPVYYVLTSKGRSQLTPRLFYLDIADSYLYESLHNNEVFLKEFQNDDEFKIETRKFIERLGVIHLYIILKSFEYKDFNWLNELNSSMLDLVLFEHFIAYRIKNPEIKVVKSIDDLDLTESTKEVDGIEFKPLLKSRDIEKIMTIIKNNYPEEIKKFDDVILKDEKEIKKLRRDYND